MEMWRIVVINIHINNDSEKFANFWHRAVSFISFCKVKHNPRKFQIFAGKLIKTKTGGHHRVGVRLNRLVNVDYSTVQNMLSDVLRVG